MRRISLETSFSEMEKPSTPELVESDMSRSGRRADVRHFLVVRVLTDRGQVELEVAGVNDRAVWRGDHDAERIRNGVDRVEEADVEVLGLDGRVFVDFNNRNFRRVLVFGKLFLNEGFREAGA